MPIRYSALILLAGLVLVYAGMEAAQPVSMVLFYVMGAAAVIVGACELGDELFFKA
ncbi:hypothetical protein [uncultured Pseudacidovorax sp.]|uniref:hypothetical protein n=1 Tax=uncultured Pseudacidovorax sp. TaxID=679313 RepID=UPI0025F4A77C|nr:hypothetical protein [uncultured Pseudacidovorax sp.]